jgi:hypothetical protein
MEVGQCRDAKPFVGARPSCDPHLMLLKGKAAGLDPKGPNHETRGGGRG